MSSYDGAKSARQSKRYSVTAVYLSMSAKEKDLEIDDDLAKGASAYPTTRPDLKSFSLVLIFLRFCARPQYSPEIFERSQVENFVPVEEELRSRKGCQVSGFENSFAHSESDGIGGGKALALS